MPSQRPPETLGVVWASIFLTALIAWGLTIVAFFKVPQLTPVAITLIIGIVPGFITVPLLLAVPGEHPTTLAIGRVLAWMQALVLLVACIIVIVVAVE